MVVLEIKIQCVCGGRYKFDVEPVDGVMPTNVQCPFCGVDGTQAANSVIAAFDKKADPKPASNPRKPARTFDVVVPPPLKCSFGLGVLGALSGAALATLLWYLAAHFLGVKLGACAVGVGLMSGLGCRCLGRFPCRSLGVIAALCALLGIFGAYYLQERAQHQFEAKEMDELFFDELLSVRDLINAVPDGADSQIVKYLTTTRGQNASISAKDIADFRKIVWQPAKDLRDGKIDLTQYRQLFHQEKRDPIFNYEFLGNWVRNLGAFNVGFLIVGFLVAYKLGAGEG